MTSGSLDVGSPVLYKRTRVGRVVGYTFDPVADDLAIRIFVEEPYQALVTPQARFWNASGIDVRLNASGLTINTQTLASVIAGGVAFEIPPGAARGAPAPSDSSFVLFGDRRSALAPEDGSPVAVRMVFDQTARGLADNAPIDFLGIEIGRVRSVQLQYDAKRQRFPVRVTAEIFPVRLGAVRSALFTGTEGDPAAEAEVVKRLVEKGLSAQMRTGNLLTGQLYIALELGKKAPSVKTGVVDGMIEVPTVPGALSELQPQIAAIVSKLSRVPFDEIGTSLQGAITSAQGTLVGVQDALRDARKTLQSADQAIAQLTPEAQKALGEVRATLTKAQTSLENLDRSVTDPNAPLQRSVDDTLQEVQRAAQSMRVLADYLQLHPESLLRGKPPDPVLPSTGKRPR